MRHDALAEGEEILCKGSVGHSHLRFYRSAIETSLDVGEWDDADRYGAALDDYTRSEPLPWADFFIAYGRRLGAHGCGQRDDETRRELARLRDEAVRFGLRMALPVLERALAAE